MRLDDVDGRDKPGHDAGAADVASPLSSKGTGRRSVRTRDCGLHSRWNFDRRRRIVIGSPLPSADRSDCERKRRGMP